MKEPRPFSAEEDEILSSMNAEGYSDAKIGEALGRSATGVFNRRRQRGMKKPRVKFCNRVGQWKKSDDERLTEMFRGGKSDADMASIFGRTIQSISSRRAHLGLARGNPVAELHRAKADFDRAPGTYACPRHAEVTLRLISCLAKPALVYAEGM